MTQIDQVIDALDRARAAAGYLSVAEIVSAIMPQNTVYDPFSLLISHGVTVGTRNIFFPNVILTKGESSILSIQDRNTFFPNALIVAEQGGKILIGSGTEFGEGGVSVKANRATASIEIGNVCRLINGPLLLGQTRLGDGAQVIGNITVQDCALEGGSDYRDPDPDKRAGLLKGSGVARNLTVPRGYVINAVGDFAAVTQELQRTYHPKR